MGDSEVAHTGTANPLPKSNIEASMLPKATIAGGCRNSKVSIMSKMCKWLTRIEAAASMGMNHLLNPMSLYRPLIAHARKKKVGIHHK